MKSTLKGTQLDIVKCMLNDASASIPQIANQLQLHPRGIAKHIKSLQEQGIIRREGPDKGGIWVVLEKTE
ncbi:MAG: helix-turn-helix transcriptional regulator [Bacteroidaceae bacterium]|nr:helix-turn-helix transcriptional regulator [Bacteroidaceae bacterium]